MLVIVALDDETSALDPDYVAARIAGALRVAGWSNFTVRAPHFTVDVP